MSYIDCMTGNDHADGFDNISLQLGLSVCLISVPRDMQSYKAIMIMDGTFQSTGSLPYRQLFRIVPKDDNARKWTAAARTLLYADCFDNAVLYLLSSDSNSLLFVIVPSGIVSNSTLRYRLYDPFSSRGNGG